mmetsp:Transcript_118462/g.340174  ORF Transcript_118462/g.340174 Transcript_118462/m.340174 type:complete len:219 (-) Transcript_118462:258-914(-)
MVDSLSKSEGGAFVPVLCGVVRACDVALRERGMQSVWERLFRARDAGCGKEWPLRARRTASAGGTPPRVRCMASDCRVAPEARRTSSARAVLSCRAGGALGTSGPASECHERSSRAYSSCQRSSYIESSSRWKKSSSKPSLKPFSKSSLIARPACERLCSCGCLLRSPLAASSFVGRGQPVTAAHAPRRGGGWKPPPAGPRRYDSSDSLHSSQTKFCK